MQNPIRTGLLAYGMSGRLFHAPFIATHPGFKLYAVTERSVKKAADRYPDIQSYGSTEELLADDSIELVIVNTPNNTHFEFAKQALSAGKHVLVEKPFTTSVQEAKELYSLSKNVGKYVLPYQNRRWDSDFLSVRNVLSEGRLGRLVEVNIRFDRFRREIGPKKFKETPLPGSGISYDLGSHLIDQVISLLGKPLKSSKLLGNYREGTQVDDYAHFHLVYPDDLNVFVTATMLAADPQPAFVLNGVNGSYIKYRTDVQEDQLNLEILPTDESFGKEAPDVQGKLTFVDENGDKNINYIPSLKGEYNKLFDAVYNQIRENIGYPIKEEAIIWQLEILEKDH